MTDLEFAEAVTARRYRRIVLPLDHVLDLFAGRVKLTGLPSGARAKSAGYDEGLEAFVILIVHTGFEPVVLGQQLPRFVVGVQAELEVLGAGAVDV